MNYCVETNHAVSIVGVAITLMGNTENRPFMNQNDTKYKVKRLTAANKSYREYSIIVKMNTYVCSRPTKDISIWTHHHCFNLFYNV